MNRMLGIVVVAVGAGALTAACATTRAQTPTQRPALEVPPVPPRVIEPVLPPEPATLEPVGELPSAPSTNPPRPRPNAQRETAREAKSEAKPPEQAQAETVTPPPPQPAPVGPLRTSRTADGAKTEQQIRDILRRTTGLLGKVNYQGLTQDRQKVYNDAKNFMDGAETAIKEEKFELALELAEKAETLAKGLQG
jgi:type IV secretory pathway VirB10-like protein